jgi:large subunit ribosomal protein L15
MAINHRKKSSRHRGSWTHGWGEKKKHRGAGSRGGRGNAGSGKRGDVKAPSFWKIKKYFGKHGFKNPASKKVNTVTISSLNSSVQQLVGLGQAVKSNDVYKLNLSELGFDKLLGTGKPLYVFEVVIANATDSAVKKIQEAGGSVLITADSSVSDNSYKDTSSDDSSEE